MARSTKSAANVNYERGYFRFAEISDAAISLGERQTRRGPFLCDFHASLSMWMANDDPPSTIHDSRFTDLHHLLGNFGNSCEGGFGSWAVMGCSPKGTSTRNPEMLQL
jgi:hypothetical protein